MAGDAEATGLTQDQAAKVFEEMLTRAEAGDGDPEAQGEDPQPEAEEAPQATEEPDAEEEPAEGEEDAEEGSQQPQTFKVIVDGQEQEVPLEELLKGYSREADYTRKTMAVAEERKRLEAEAQQFSATRERTTSLLQVLEQQLSAPLYDQQEMEWLRINDPGEFAARRADEVDRMNRLQAVTAQRQQLAAQAMQQEAAQAQAFRQEQEQRLLQAQPDWKDPVKGKMAMETIRNYMLSQGATPDEIAATFDHRIVLAFYKAAKFDEMQAKGAPRPDPKAAPAIRAARPGVATSQAPKVTEVTRAKQRLAKTGNVDDAAAVFMKMLE